MKGLWKELNEDNFLFKLLAAAVVSLSISISLLLLMIYLAVSMLQAMGVL